MIHPLEDVVCARYSARQEMLSDSSSGYRPAFVPIEAENNDKNTPETADAYSGGLDLRTLDDSTLDDLNPQ